MNSTHSSEPTIQIPTLERLDPSKSHGFTQPKKMIHGEADVMEFLTTKGYADVMTFLMQLNRAMFPSYIDVDGQKAVQAWELGSPKVTFSKAVVSLQNLMAKLEGIIEEVPPDPGPRRFGNISFRKWYDLVRERASDLLTELLPHEIFEFDNTVANDPGPRVELQAYFEGSFGSSQRLDYGTGHELSFLAFVGSIWKLGGFEKAAFGIEERGIVLGVIEPYLNLCRKLIKTYTLEPAGSHGVWGLDDHFFLPFIFGSAQLGPPISATDPVPVQESYSSAPEPSEVAKASVVRAERKRNMYFSAVGFIYDVKRGPFGEHSPMLFDISGITAGWGKINKGMLKMYHGEVLSKFPVVQHFPFGHLFSFDQDPNAESPDQSAHLSNAADSPQPNLPVPSAPLRDPLSDQAAAMPGRDPPSRDPMVPTRAPWAMNPTMPPSGGVMPSTRAPWASGGSGPPVTRAPGAASTPPGVMAPTRAPWAQAKR